MAGKLTALKMRTLEPGRYGDGGGLWLQVRDADHRSWLFRYRLAGRDRHMGLGPVEDVSLAEAREKARDARRLILDGLDPLDARRERQAERVRAQALTFAAVAERYIAAHEATWRNSKHRQQWRNTLDAYALPVFGDRPVSMIAVGEVMQALEPIWRAKPETASRVRGRIESVLDYATARGWRMGENPARWRGHLQNLLAAPGKLARVEHHAALPWREVPSFMAELQGFAGAGARALEFTILTAARTSEVTGATWAEVDLDAATWTVPGERMKAGREHRVALSPAALAVLKAEAEARPGRRPVDPLFPGARAGKPLSNMAMTATLRRMASAPEAASPVAETARTATTPLSAITVHGFRSAFRDWVGEATHYPRELAEQALAHVNGDKVEAAYRRGDALDKRRAMMTAWAEFCMNPAPAGNVVPLARAG